MTDPNPHDIQSALDVVKQLLGLLGDPATMQKLKLLQGEALRQVQREEKRTRAYEAIRGTCPTCGRQYGINKSGTLRRHGKGRCYTEHQLPMEVVPAILAIAELSADVGEATNDAGKQRE